MKIRGSLVAGMCGLLIMLAMITIQAEANPLIYNGSSGSLGASAAFNISGGSLFVTLTNTSGADVLTQGDVLTGLFFEVAGDPLFSKTSAVLAPGSTVVFPPAGNPSGTGPTPVGSVGEEWGYRNGLAGYLSPTSTVNEAILSAAYGGVFSTWPGGGTSSLFTPGNLQGEAGPGKLQYGITSSSDNPLTGSTDVKGANALINYSAIFTLDSLSSGFDLSSISNVYFQYGINITDPRFAGVEVPAVPEPSTILLLLVGFAIAGVRKLIVK